ncbi:MAG TPA: 50S ribosomal protein L30 [Trueperaceae bacterium]|jgi:large subunit ribosomal protein L30|nr:50S ribosomal protein L30 [Trueperaceae bacterium]HRP47509.1 50S ribosomal protein L30 [Trueperaceae bacterium]
MKLKLVRSLIGTTKTQRGTVNALGLKKIGDVREVVDNESTRGMVEKVKHLLVIEGNEKR